MLVSIFTWTVHNKLLTMKSGPCVIIIICCFHMLDPTVVDKNGCNSLHIAVFSGIVDTHVVEIVELLLKDRYVCTQ